MATIKQTELQHSDIWTGRYRGITFKIKRWRWSAESKDNWAYYLYVNEQQFPKSERDAYIISPTKDTKGRLRYDYMNCGWNNIDAHGGWTFYERSGGYLDTPCGIKIGCDYGHCFDEGCRYDEKEILVEVQRSIDQLHNAVTGFMVWSEMDGNYRTEAETETFNAEYRKKRNRSNNK